MSLWLIVRFLLQIPPRRTTGRSSSTLVVTTARRGSLLARLAPLLLAAAGLSASARSPRSRAFLLPRSSSFYRSKAMATTESRSAPTPPPLPAMEGTLFTYHRDEYQNRVAFRSGSAAHRRHVVLLGGLGDGLLPVPYTRPLAAALDAKGWGLVQVLLSSAYTGFGHSSLQTDAQDLGYLLGFLEDQLGSEAIGIVGHSTGCQDCMVYAREGTRQGKLRFLVLQAPVSDREHMLAASAKAPEFVAHARALVAGGKGEEMLPREAMWAPITARRFLDLATKEGADDFFSSDLTDEELAERLGHLHVPTLFLFSGADEYVPSHVDVPKLGARFIGACKKQCPLPRAVVVEGARHAGKGHEAAVVKEIVAFVEEAMAVAVKR